MHPLPQPAQDLGHMVPMVLVEVGWHPIRTGKWTRLHISSTPIPFGKSGFLQLQSLESGGTGVRGLQADVSSSCATPRGRAKMTKALGQKSCPSLLCFPSIDEETKAQMLGILLDVTQLIKDKN